MRDIRRTPMFHRQAMSSQPGIMLC